MTKQFPKTRKGSLRVACVFAEPGAARGRRMSAMKNPAGRRGWVDLLDRLIQYSRGGLCRIPNRCRIFRSIVLAGSAFTR